MIRSLTLRVMAIVLAVAMTACGSNSRSVADLERADALVETAPDSALAILDSLSPDGFTRGDSALYALLLTQARVKCNVPIRSDSLIRRAREFYRFGSDRGLRRRAAFYAGYVANSLGRLPVAMSGAIEAYDLALADNDHYWRAKSAELVADIFDASYNYQQEEKFRREAAEQYLLAGKITNHRYTLCDLACTYYNMRRFATCRDIVDSIRSVVDSVNPIDSALYNYASGYLQFALLELGEYEEAEIVHEEYRPYKNVNEEFEKNLIESYFAADNGEEAVATTLLSNAYGLTEDQQYGIRAIYAAYEQALFRNDFEQAVVLADSLLTMQSNICEGLLSESISLSIGDYYKAMSIEQKVVAQRNKIIVCVVSLAAAIIIVIMVVLYHKILQKKRIELQANVAELFVLSSRNDEQSKIIEKLYKNRWSTFNKLYDEYFEFEKSTRLNSMLIKKLQSIRQEIQSEESFAELEKNIDDYFGGVISKLRKEAHELKEDDFRFMVLIIGGLSAKSVCLILNLGYKNFYQKRDRLIEKLKKSGVSDVNRITELLGKNSRRKQE